MGIARVTGATVDGIAAHPVEVQCALADGLPGFAIIGLADRAVSEARERVRAALASVGAALPPRRISVSLVPGDLPKSGAGLDLPIALSLLVALEILPSSALDGTLVIGELALDGQLLAPAGLLLAAISALSTGNRLVMPQAGLDMLTPLVGLEVTAAPDLPSLLEALRSGKRNRIGSATATDDEAAGEGKPALPDGTNHSSKRYASARSQTCAPGKEHAAVEASARNEHRRHGGGNSPGPEAGDLSMIRSAPDMADIKGQERARRALEIAAAGRHHLLMVGPPGAGKSMLAERLPGLMPRLERKAHLEVLAIHAAAGRMEDVLSRRPPFRHPHHTASVAALIGGGPGAGPGEISLAHHGVLFLDELPEFSRPALEGLREPLETGQVTIARANALNLFPARFLLVAAANPCRCGNAYGGGPPCGQAPRCSEKYLARISGPLLDRFDMRLTLASVPVRELSSMAPGETTSSIAKRVAAARSLQARRWQDLPHIETNADAASRKADARLAIREEAREVLIEACDRLGLSARGFSRIQRVARTIADLEGSEDVTAAHMAEALSYRLPTRNPEPAHGGTAVF